MTDSSKPIKTTLTLERFSREILRPMAYRVAKRHLEQMRQQDEIMKSWGHQPQTWLQWRRAQVVQYFRHLWKALKGQECDNGDW